ncbi:MAG TPA: Nif3-like dinuclear metal center hexameric protein [Saprospiraceae bacterium]|nr:Nif3-like dinuclear metal center hexameric protein [Saprospiraceae bacterium]HMP23485.1 Nif3-like dinuclear metal center hexameric protein [Saprospiraceae bacterium]
MKIQELIAWLETIAPPVYQEDYDNAGLLVGNANAELRGVLCCLDATEAVVQEALALQCNLIVAHHPIVFRGLKRLTGRTYVERVVMQAIKNDIAIYAIHTNLDNVYHQGVNAKICEKLGLVNTRILAPKQVLRKLAVPVSPENAKIIRNLLLGAGLAEVSASEQVNYTTEGSETYIRLEALVPTGLESNVQAILRKHDLVAEIFSTDTPSTGVGSGMIGELPAAVPEADFLQQLKQTMQAGVVRHTALRGQAVRTVAVCGGAGGFLLGNAIRQQADVFVTSDYKYHEFFDADGKIIIADIGHFESEQFTIELLYEIISKKISNFALHCTTVRTNPVYYV